MEIIFMNTENSKINKSHKFVFNLSQRFYLGSLDKHVTLQNLSIYYTRENTRKEYEIINFKIIAATWNDQFELPDGFYLLSVIQDYTELIIKKHETITIFPPIHVYINRINNRSVFKIKDGCKLELETPETMKLFWQDKKVDRIKKNAEKVPSLEVVEVVLV